MQIVLAKSDTQITLLERQWSVAGIPRYCSVRISYLDTSRISSCFSDLRAVSRINSCCTYLGIPSTLHYLSIYNSE